MHDKFREPVSGFTHLFGALLSIVGLILFILYTIPGKGPEYVITFAIFGVSLILLYTASSVYHLVTVSEKAIRVLRRIDHSMIYVLIAGTYTPVCLIALRGRFGWSLFSIIWGLAVVGILVKNFWFSAPRWLSTLFYLLMGWFVVIAIVPLARVLPFYGLMWLVAGGISYTIGGIIYATKWPKITSEVFGFHEIFHCFVLLGSFCHFWLMLRYVLHI